MRQQLTTKEAELQQLQSSEIENQMLKQQLTTKEAELHDYSAEDHQERATEEKAIGTYMYIQTYLEGIILRFPFPRTYCVSVCVYVCVYLHVCLRMCGEEYKPRTGS